MTAAPLVALQATPADRAALAEVLARPEFRAQRLDLLALRRVLIDWWERLLELLGTAEAEQYASLGRLVFLVAAAVAALLLWRAMRRRRAGPDRRTGADAGGIRASPGEEPLDPRAAERAIQLGDLGGAVRSAYLLAAAALGRDGRAPADAALTGSELAARCRDAGFDELARLHERTLFGRRPVALAEALRAVDLARRLGGAEVVPP